jgi:hypothetical protein
LFQRFKDSGKNIFNEQNGTADTNRIHWYFLVEYLLITSGYSIGDLMLPVTSDFECHHSTITSQLLGFIYFLIFEFLYHKQIYKGAPGRSLFLQRADTIQFFVDVATEEYEQCFGVTDSKSAAELLEQRTQIIKFYK